MLSTCPERIKTRATRIGTRCHLVLFRDSIKLGEDQLVGTRIPLGKSFAQAHGFLWPITDDRKTLGQFFKVALAAGWGEDDEYPGGDRSLVPERVLALSRNEDKGSCRSLNDLFVCLEPERTLQHVESLILLNIDL